jgi:hypothetical protein
MKMRRHLIESLLRYGRTKRAVAAAVVTVAAFVGVLLPAADRAGAALPSAQSAAFFDSEPGEALGLGREINFPTVTYDGLRNGYPTFTVANGTDSFSVWFANATGAGPLTPGNYENAQRFDVRAAGHPGLDVFRDTRGCSTLDGRFVVDDATYTVGGDVQTFSARFEAHCEGEVPALFGAISYNSTADYRTRSITPGSITFNTAGTTAATKTVTITNNGPSTLTPTGFAISGPNAAQFAISANTCTATLSSGSACAVTVRYTPGTSTAIHEDATLSFFDELAAQGTVGEAATVGTGRDIALVGNRSTLSISPASAAFGYQSVGDYTVPPTTFTVTNHGGAPVTISDIAIIGGNFFDWFGNTSCNSTVAPGASCAVTVYFAPTRLGTRHSELVVTDNAVGGSQRAALSGTGTEGYYLAGAAGEIGNFGYAGFYGDVSNVRLNAPIVSIAATGNGRGYWLLGKDGGIFSFGNARFFGSTGGIPLNKPVLGMARTRDGAGYWLVASDGGIFAFGDAQFYGSTGGIRLNKPVVGMATTPTGKGYWLVASDGGIFTFGDAHFYGSTGAVRLNKPIIGMATTPTGKGYWLLASDGGIFTFGDAGFFGSTGGVTLFQPIVGMAATPTGHGYWMVASDGGVFNFGDAPFDGSLGGRGITDAIGIATTSPPLTPFIATHAVGLTPIAGRALLTGPPSRPFAPRE